MSVSRRDFLGKSAPVAATGVLGILAATDAQSARAAEDKKPACKETAMVAACGLSCMACPLMKAGKCKGCASGKEASEEMLKKKPCPVLRCAAMKGIDYCGTGCKMFTKCKKLIGKPYAQSFMDMVERRMNT